MKLLIVSLRGDAPIQGFGWLNGHPWYFRARGDRWEFAVAAGRDWFFENAVAATANKGYGLVLTKRYPDTTSLSFEKARAIIRRAARAAEAFME